MYLRQRVFPDQTPQEQIPILPFLFSQTFTISIHRVDERVLINKQHNIISLWILVFIPFIYGIISQFVSFHPVANECLLANIVLIFRALHGIKELNFIDVFGKLHILLAKRVIS